MKYTKIKHLSHPHDDLMLVDSPQAPYKCDGCKELGFRRCYQCEDCNFHLHEECAMPDSSAFHPLFRKCDFRFYENAPGNRARYCDACGKDVLGFVYQCLHKEAHDLHPCCMKLPRTLIGDGVKLHLSDMVSSKCQKCGSKEISKGFRGWSYESTCGKYCYHVACVKDLVIENWRKGYFDGHNDVNDQILSNMAIQIKVPNEDIVQQSEGSSYRSKKASKYWKIAKLALKLIISAIFGDPISGFTALIESVVSS
ncbi:hypothetical protein F2P56_028442 [Juglans regia]|uniref:Uncharacterized protein LOC109022265 n=2 Tax=Juglans regia TaxID=51240 RepID=A0A6P9E894_JUGRE|nr:uncharacterized protein LOC109022265 [Juglans regia]KAF5453545.1 hypothetical protein F2P56_028442 [Juglans regia]